MFYSFGTNTSLCGQLGFSHIYLLERYQHNIDSGAICTPIQICLKMAPLLGNIGMYLVNNTHCANFVVAILALALIEGRAERICADSDVDSATGMRIVAAAARRGPPDRALNAVNAVSGALAPPRPMMLQLLCACVSLGPGRQPDTRHKVITDHGV